MPRQLTLSEAILAGVLFLFAMGTARVVDFAATDRENEYKVAIAHTNAYYRSAKNACQSRQGNDHDVCLPQSKPDHVKATTEAKARVTLSTVIADAREDTMDAQYETANEKCHALPADAKDSCIKN
jgi:hypothetical protein